MSIVRRPLQPSSQVLSNRELFLTARKPSLKYVNSLSFIGTDHSNIVANEMTVELTRDGSLSINLPFEDTVKPRIIYYVSRFLKVLIGKAGNWKLIARYLGPSGRQP